MLAFELNVCELPLFLFPSSVHFPPLSFSLTYSHTFPVALVFSVIITLSSSFLFLLYQAEGGSGHERAATLLLDSDVVAGAEVRRISIGFEPDATGRLKTP